MKKFDKKTLERFLENCKNFCILCIGNPLRGDDAIGMIIGQRLKKYFRNVFVAEMDLTAYLSKIREFDGIIIIDSARMGTKPGEIRILEKEELRDFLHTTHDIPLKVFLEILGNKNILIIGIEPKNTNFGEKISNSVRRASEIIFETISEVLKNLNIYI